MTKSTATIMIAACLFATCLLATGLVGCKASEPEQTQAPETPAQGISAIIQLYEASDFESLVRTRYAEIDKAENEEQIQTLIDRLSTRFEDDETRSAAIAAYKAALLVEPVISTSAAGAEVATFEVDAGSIKISRMTDGRWGFHL